MSLFKNFDLSVKKSQGQPKFIIFEIYWAYNPNTAYQVPGLLAHWRRRRF